MPIATIRLQDGRIVKVQVPDGATQEQIGSFVQQNLPQISQTAPQEDPVVAPQEETGQDDIFRGLPQETIDKIISQTQLAELPQGAAAPPPLPGVSSVGAEVSMADLPNNLIRRAADLERLRIQNPVLAKEIESMGGLEVFAIGAGEGFMTLGRAVGAAEQATPSERANIQALKGQRPVAFGAGEILAESAPFVAAAPLAGAGLVAQVGGRSLIPAAQTLTGRIAGASALSGTEGAAIAKGKGKTGLEVAKAGVISGALGPVGEIAAPIIRSVSGLRRVSQSGKDLLKEPTKKEVLEGLAEAAPTIDQLKSSSREIYKGIDDLGVKLTPEAFDGFSNSTLKSAKDVGFIDSPAGKALSPEGTKILNLVDEIKKSGDLTVENMEAVRKVAQNSASKAARAGDNADSAIAGSVVDSIDEFLTTINAKSFSGAKVNIGDDLSVARKLWGRARRAEILDEAIETGISRQAGAERGIRNEFNRVLNNKKKSRFLTASDKEAMQNVVRGTTSANTFRRLGQFGFGKGQQTNVLSGLAGAGVGSTALSSLFGPLGAGIGLVILPAVGTISKNLAENLTKKNAALANQIVRAGANAEDITRAYLRNTPASQRSSEDLSSLLIRSDIDLNTARSEIALEAANIAKTNRLTAVAPVIALPAAAEEQ